MNSLLTTSFLSYADLKKEADLEAGGEESPAAGIEMSKTQDESLGPFLEEAGRVKEEMASIRALLSLLETASEESKLTRNPDASRAARDRMNAHITHVLNTARRIRQRLEAMDRANALNRRLSGCREGTPVDRTRSSVTNGLRNKLKDLMMDFQGLRQRMMSDYRHEVERRHFAETGEVPSEAVVEKMMISQGKSALAATVHEIRDRHDAAKEVERSLLELHQSSYYQQFSRRTSGCLLFFPSMLEVRSGNGARNRTIFEQYWQHKTGKEVRPSMEQEIDQCLNNIGSTRQRRTSLFH